MIWSISWKNVWRSKVRSLVVIIAVILGLFGGTFSAALMYGMSQNRVDEAIKNEVSHIQIHNPKFLQNKDIVCTITDVKNKIKQIEALEEVDVASARIKQLIMAKTSTTGTGVNVLGINPQKEKLVSSVYKAIYDSTDVVDKLGISNIKQIQQFVKDSCGKYFEAGRKNQVVIGEELASKLKVKVRSKIILNFQNLDGEFTGGAFRVVGIFRTNNSNFEASYIFVNYDDIAKLLGFDNNKAHEIAIKLKDGYKAAPVAEKLKKMYLDLNVMTWKEIQPELGMMTDWMNAMLYVFMVIILLALGFGIVNTMLMVVLERVKEIGMLMAIGMNKIRIFGMIMLETIFLSITGGVIGLIISYFAIEIFAYRGINLKLFSKGLEALGYQAIMYPKLNFDFYLTITILVIITGILSSIYPAIKALKLNPAEAIRIE
ncbi:MAG: FtsX-like permease family protein [Bacteroidales bacterium]|jgi:putative ABC transport system permease protein|nr:FtsX-like permease family protein [Bacteroidales bacterium]